MNKVHVAIIGAGISGLSLAHHLNTNKHIEYDIFEKRKQPGGRIKGIRMSDNSYWDVGAEFLLQSNKNVWELIEDFGLETEGYIEERAIYSHEKNRHVMLPNTSGPKLELLKSAISMISYLGLKNIGSLKKVFSLSKEAAKVYNDITNIQRRSVSDFMLGIAGQEIKEKYGHLLEQSFAQYMLDNGVSKSVIDNFLDPSFRSVYQTDVYTISALYGISSLALSSETILHVKGGNKHLIDALVKDVKTHNKDISYKTVKKIRKDGKKYYVDQSSKAYDYVFVATAPAFLRHIEFNGFSNVEMQRLEALSSIKYHEPVYHHLVRGKLKKEFKKLFDRGIETIWTGGETNVWELNQIDEGMWDLSAQQAFEESDYDKYFEHCELVQSIKWKYPYPYYDAKTTSSLPFSNRINDEFYAGTDLLLAALDNSVGVAKNIAQIILQAPVIQELEEIEIEN